MDFQSLYEKYAPAVRRFALFLCGEPAMADDIASETFVRVWLARGRIRELTVKSYLFAVARNAYRDLQPRGWRRAALDVVRQSQIHRFSCRCVQHRQRLLASVQIASYNLHSASFGPSAVRGNTETAYSGRREAGFVMTSTGSLVGECPVRRVPGFCFRARPSS
jgi:hypothetical protein